MNHLTRIGYTKLAGFTLALVFAMPSTTAASSLDTAEVISRKLVIERVVDGVVEAVKQGTVSAQTSGRVQEVDFDVDDYVPKGAIIVRFRDKEQQAGLQVATAGLKEAEARYAEADAEHKRIADVVEKQVVPRAALDKATADLNAARQRVESAQGRVTQAQEQLEHTVVRAPYSGIVVKRHIEVGENANPGQPLMSGFALDELRVTANVPQAAIQAIRTHNRARILFPTQQDRAVDAKSLRIFPFADPQSHTYKVRLNLAPGQDGILPGMFAKVVFVTGEEPRLVVPAQALVQRGEVDGVYVVGADSRVALRQVRVGRRLDDGHLEVLAGLSAGERVAIDPIRAGVALKEQPAKAP